MIENPTGVWIENGMVYRSDFGESPKLYKPKESYTPEEVAEIVGQIKEIGCGDRWLKVDEEALDAKLDQLNEIAVF